MAKNITVIPATIDRFTDLPLTTVKKRKVAAYARVSTDHEEQQNSYEAQVSYYTEYIKNRSDWEFAGIFADEGISGCSIKGRKGFQKMIEEALAGRIDLILTKSVSRFARNTVDSLSTIRELKEHNVECYFEKENIWTFDSKCELMLTVMSSISQEESRSISENVTWGHRRRMAEGKVAVPFGRFLEKTLHSLFILIVKKSPKRFEFLDILRQNTVELILICHKQLRPKAGVDLSDPCRIAKTASGIGSNILAVVPAPNERSSHHMREMACIGNDPVMFFRRDQPYLATAD